MRLSNIAVTGLLPAAMAWRGMEDTLEEILKRDTLKEAGCGESTELIGDLTFVSDYDLSPVGHRVRNILLGLEPGESHEIYDYVPPLGSYACERDTCCVWWYIVDEMEKLFKGPSGRCTNAARAAIRLGFHDAAGWSKFTGPFGGADGSIVLAPEEMTRRANAGLAEIVDQMKIWFEQWHGYGISMADLIQMAGTVATVVCPLYVPPNILGRARFMKHTDPREIVAPVFAPLSVVTTTTLLASTVSYPAPLTAPMT